MEYRAVQPSLEVQLRSKKIGSDDGVAKKKHRYRAIKEESFAAGAVVLEKKVTENQAEREEAHRPLYRREAAPRFAQRWDLQVVPEFQQLPGLPPV